MVQESCLYRGTKTYLPLKILESMGRGKCEDCQYDPKNNKKCSAYYPITKFRMVVVKPSIESKI